MNGVHCHTSAAMTEAIASLGEAVQASASVFTPMRFSVPLTAPKFELSISRHTTPTTTGGSIIGSSSRARNNRVPDLRIKQQRQRQANQKFQSQSDGGINKRVPERTQKELIAGEAREVCQRPVSGLALQADFDRVDSRGRLLTESKTAMVGASRKVRERSIRSVWSQYHPRERMG
jgi:hypothetical protein